MKAARELNYIYNAAVGDIISKKSSVIGLLTPKIGNSLFGSSLMEIQKTAAQKGLSVILGCTRYDVEVERHLLTQFQERRVAAIILTGFALENKPAIERIVSSGLPCIVTWEKMESTDICYVGFDNRKAAFTATNHLLSLGHRRIGLIAGPFSVIGRVYKRLQGYRDALESYGVEYDPELVVEHPPTLMEGKAAAEKLLSLKKPPSGIFAASDILAIGAMQAIHSRGLKMPNDISLIGFDDIEFSAYMNPPLSSIRVDAIQIGKLAAEIAIEAVSCPSRISKQYCLDTDLVVRSTSGPLRPRSG
jgi:DNA-binding LacI/PurR family transcriptional regulator